MSAICQVFQPSHLNQRGSTQSKLQSFSCFSPFFIQRSWRFVYQLFHVISWSTKSWILTNCLPSLDCPSLTAYKYLPTSASGYLPPLIYFRTSRFDCLIFNGAILTFWESPSMPWITFSSALTALSAAIVLLSLFVVYRVTRYQLR